MSTKLYLRDSEQGIMSEASQHEYIGEMKDEFKIGHILKIKDKLYTCVQTSFNAEALFDPITFKDFEHCEELETYEDAWTCPLCGYEDYDSYELDNSKIDYECPGCGAITKYEVEYTANYSVTLIQAPEIKELKN